jgi:hypothetical protein
MENSISALMNRVLKLAFTLSGMCLKKSHLTRACHELGTHVLLLSGIEDGGTWRGKKICAAG